MIHLIKNVVMFRLLTEKKENAKHEGRFITFMSAAFLTGFSVMGLFILLQFAFDCLRFLASREAVIVVFVITSIISTVLAKRGYYEQTRDYIDTLDVQTLKAMHKRYFIIVGATTSIYFVAGIALLIKNF